MSQREESYNIFQFLKEMNIINHCNVEYITASKTIEIVSLKNSDSLFYIYNFGGNHFRVFTELLSLINFFQFGVEPKDTFSNDEELDDFISSYSFDN